MDCNSCDRGPEACDRCDGTGPKCPECGAPLGDAGEPCAVCAPRVDDSVRTALHAAIADLYGGVPNEPIDVLIQKQYDVKGGFHVDVRVRVIVTKPEPLMEGPAMMPTEEAP